MWLLNGENKMTGLMSVTDRITNRHTDRTAIAHTALACNGPRFRNLHVNKFTAFCSRVDKYAMHFKLSGKNYKSIWYNLLLQTEQPTIYLGLQLYTRCQSNTLSSSPIMQQFNKCSSAFTSSLPGSSLKPTQE